MIIIKVFFLKVDVAHNIFKIRFIILAFFSKNLTLVFDVIVRCQNQNFLWDTVFTSTELNQAKLACDGLS